MTSHTLLVTGASGRLGRLVIERLLERHAAPIIAVTRTPEHLSDLTERGVLIRHADFDAPEGLADAFAGADRMLLISTDTLDGSGRRPEQHRRAILAAAEAGVQHVVYTSFLKATDSPLAAVVADHAATEAALAASGLGYTILRFSFFAEMMLTLLNRISADGTLWSAAGEGRTSFIMREDCALAAAAALASDFVGRRRLDIAGPLLDGWAMARMAGARLGRPVVIARASAEAVAARLAAGGMAPAMAGMLAMIDSGIACGALDADGNDFQRLTGRDPTSIEAYLSALPTTGVA